MLVFLTTFLAPAFACRRGARERGPAPPNRRVSKIRRKTPEINLRRTSVLDLSLPPLVRLAGIEFWRRTGPACIAFRSLRPWIARFWRRRIVLPIFVFVGRREGWVLRNDYCAQVVRFRRNTHSSAEILQRFRRTPLVPHV